MKEADISELEVIVKTFIRNDPYYAERVVESLAQDEKTLHFYEQLKCKWELWERDDQKIDTDQLKIDGYYGLLVLCGRAWGKTRKLAENTRKKLFSPEKTECGIIGKTRSDIVDTIIDGPSGIWNCLTSWEKRQIDFHQTRLVMRNIKTGTKIQFIQADRPDKIRGKNWFEADTDELCKYQYGEEVLQQLSLAVRIGPYPFKSHFTTPKPTNSIFSLVDNNKIKVIKRPSTDNKYLPAMFFEDAKRTMSSWMYQQEILAILHRESPFSLFKRKWIDDNRMKFYDDDGMPICKPLDIIKKLDLYPIIIAVDPSVTSDKFSDETGIIVGGYSKKFKKAIILEDGTQPSTATSKKWSLKIEELHKKWYAGKVIVESNQGQDLLKVAINSHCQRKMHIEKINAKESKQLRADPVSALYENGEVAHWFEHPDLEQQMTTWDPKEVKTTKNGKKTSKSPDRLDALVHLVTELLLKQHSQVMPLNTMIFGKKV